MRTWNSLLLAFVCLALTACGGGLVRGEPPLVGISSISTQPETIGARVDFYNPNSVDIRIETIELAMTLGDTELGTQQEQPGLSLHPNGTEEIIFDFPANEQAGEQLADLENRVINSVPYSVSGRVISSDGYNEQFSQDGYLYPIPGRPGEFRGAGPQSDRP